MLGEINTALQADAAQLLVDARQAAVVAEAQLHAEQVCDWLPDDVRLRRIPMSTQHPWACGTENRSAAPCLSPGKLATRPPATQVCLATHAFKRYSLQCIACWAPRLGLPHLKSGMPAPTALSPHWAGPPAEPLTRLSLPPLGSWKDHGIWSGRVWCRHRRPCPSRPRDLSRILEWAEATLHKLCQGLSVHKLSCGSSAAAGLHHGFNGWQQCINHRLDEMSRSLDHVMAATMKRAVLSAGCWECCCV